MTDDTTNNSITDDIVKAAAKAASTTPAVYSGDQPVQLQDVQYRGGLTFVYPAGPFCSTRLHDDLRDVQARTGVQLSYFNVSNPGSEYRLPNGDPAPGYVRSDRNSASAMSRLGLSVFDPVGALVDSRGNVVARLRLPVFGGSVRELVSEINSLQQGRSR